MRPFKFNSTYPKLSQFVHDIFWSNVSAVMSTAFEVVILYYVWSHTWTPEKAAVPWYADWRTVLWLLGMPCESTVGPTTQLYRYCINTTADACRAAASGCC